MQRIGPGDVCCDHRPDNWRFQSGTTTHVSLGMSRGFSVPQIVVDAPPPPLPEWFGTRLTAVHFNINEDDEDCPGHGRSTLVRTTSSDSLYASSDDDYCCDRGRAMSIDTFDGEEKLDVANNNANSVNVSNGNYDETAAERRMVTADDAAEKTDDDASDSRPPTFFNMKRRASYDNAAFGMAERIVRGEVGGSLAERFVRTVPSTPADPSTPVGRFLSDEELLVSPEKVFKKIFDFLCAERVTQMTKTYNDIEAVTHLLEEKERDLELAARIGQTLLSKNKELSVRSDALEEQLAHANDKVNQLKHDLSMKDELLRFYCQDLQDEPSSGSSPGEMPGPLGLVNIEMLQRKVSTLEEENINLRLESAQLRTDTDHFEEKEKKLVEDCLQQLGELNQQVETFAQELRYKSEESARHKEEITSLLAQVADLHKRVRQLTIENMDLAEKLQASQESQRQLTKELSIRQDKYDELFEMLEEAQDELRGHRSRGNPKATRHCYASSALPPAAGAGADSLASELHTSLQQEEEDKQNRRSRSWKVFETARAARKAASKSSKESSVRMSTSSTSSTKDPASNAPSDSESMFSDGYSADMDSMYGSTTELGRPGIPGSNDLESALRRLAMRRANELNERDYEAQHKQGLSDRETRSEGFSPFQPQTPDSWASPGSGYSYLGFGNSHSASRQFKFPDKLQIVKPLEGSVTLQHWQRLAQPHLGGLFERREGVQVRGERKLDLDGEVYTLSDFEEDDAVPCPSRRAEDSGTIYTFTNSIVSHPGEFHISHSSSAASLPPLATSTPGTSTPKAQNRPGAAYTMPLGLAAILESREGAATRSLLHPVSSRTSFQEPVPQSPTITPSSAGPKMPSSSAPIEAGAVGGEGLPSSPSSGFLSKLMTTGYSLLWNKTSPATTPTSGANSGPVSHSGDAKPQSKAPGNPMLSGGAPSGVLGAIASFRKNGIL